MLLFNNGETTLLASTYASALLGGGLTMNSEPSSKVNLLAFLSGSGLDIGRVTALVDVLLNNRLVNWFIIVRIKGAS